MDDDKEEASLVGGKGFRSALFHMPAVSEPVFIALLAASEPPGAGA